jgi:hypothetical protein
MSFGGVAGKDGVLRQYIYFLNQPKSADPIARALFDGGKKVDVREKWLPSKNPLKAPVPKSSR